MDADGCQTFRIMAVSVRSRQDCWHIYVVAVLPDNPWRG